MKLKALSNYDGDTETRFGDCILLYDKQALVIYDCGHEKHAEAVAEFLEDNASIKDVSIVVSHGHEDHVNGIGKLFELLIDANREATVYTPLYLKDAEKVLEILDDDRRTLPATKKKILEIFDGLAAIITSATDQGFSIADARIDTTIAGTSCKIIGPTEDEFAEVIAEAVKTDGKGNIDDETVMNAASVQVKSDMENSKRVLLCGDATPEYLHDLEDYRIVQLPHHGKLSSAETVFGKIFANIGAYTFLISDNTGNSNGGSDELEGSLIRTGKFIKNTKKDGVIDLGAIPALPSSEAASKRYGVCAGL